MVQVVGLDSAQVEAESQRWRALGAKVSSGLHGRVCGNMAWHAQLINSPQNTGRTEPLAYIDASMKAGYDGVGIRTFRAPGRSYNFNPIVGNTDLERDVKS